MLQFLARPFVESLEHLKDLEAELLHGTEATYDAERVGILLGALRHDCKFLNLTSADKQVKRIFRAFDEALSKPESQGGIVRLTDLSAMLSELRCRVKEDLEEHIFFQADGRNAYPFFDRTEEDGTVTLLLKPPAQLFGDSVATNFRSTLPDFTEAVRCLVLCRSTACIFHSMRVAEIGLRALARERRIKLKKGPLEWAEWSELIREISKQVEDIGLRNPKGPQKDKFLGFFRGTLNEFEGFKDEYRNNVMHTREMYESADAERVFGRVSEFMRKLASTIDERGHKRFRWGLT
jgi:hypothetical protein